MTRAALAGVGAALMLAVAGCGEDRVSADAYADRLAGVHATLEEEDD